MNKHPSVADLPAGERSGMTLAQLRTRRDDIVRIAAAHGAANVRVFGSVARGDANAGSDVDFLVDVPQEYRGFDFFGVLDETREGLEALLGCKVDVISIRGAAAPQARPLAERICQEAVPL